MRNMVGDYDGRAIEFGFEALIQPGFRLQMPFQGVCRIERSTNLGGEDNPMVIHPPLCVSHVKGAAAENLVIRPKRTA